MLQQEAVIERSLLYVLKQEARYSKLKQYLNTVKY